MEIENLLAFLVIGAAAGWLAGKIVSGYGFGLIGNIAVGILGALIASVVLPRVGVTLGAGIVAAIVHSTLGAVILLALLRVIKRA